MANDLNKVGFQKIANYGLATYLRMKGKEFDVYKDDRGRGCYYTDISIAELEKMTEEYYNSPFKAFDNASKSLRDLKIEKYKN